MKFDLSSTVHDGMLKILRNIPVKNQEYLALFHSGSGIWLSEHRTLQSYLLVDEVT